MITFIARRILQAILILAVLTILFFALLRISAPQGPCNYILANPSPNSQTRFDQCVASRGLDKPLPLQYVSWVVAMAHGDFGIDHFGSPVLDTVVQRLPATILLVGLSYLFQQLLAIPLGLLGALKRYSIYDQVLTFFSYVGLSLPVFWLGLMLIYVFAIMFPILPSSGIIGTKTGDAFANILPNSFGTPEYWSFFGQHPGPAIGNFLWHVILPALTLAIIGIAGDSRFMRASMLEVINQDYVRTARAKGLPQSAVILKHALRNALLPIITNFGLFIPSLIGGAVITEGIFAWPGMGQYFFQAVGNHDNNALQVVLLLTALFTLVGNLVADLLYAVADPRIRYN